MNICGTCKYFGEPRSIEAYRDDDDCTEIVTNYRFCTLIRHLEGDHRFVQHPAGVIDGSGYYAALCVTSDFGCNQWSQPQRQGEL